MSQMQSSFDERARFVILWILADTWYPVLAAAAMSWLILDDLLPLKAMFFLAMPIGALCQVPLLRGRVDKVWLWPLAGLAAAIALEILTALILLPASQEIFAAKGSGLTLWLPYFLLSAALAGIALGGSQAVAMARWKLAPGGWFVVVLGASLIAGTVSGVIWFMSGAAAAGPDAGFSIGAVIAAAVRQVGFGAITGVFLWQVLKQRSVDAAAGRP
ncbi:MAG: hypothetical protein AB7R90_15210 [Reyranellaceae bacterium]